MKTLVQLSTALSFALCLSAADAATFTVTRFDDPMLAQCQPRDCSLRAAVQAASAQPGPHEILLPAGVYTLTQSVAMPRWPAGSFGALRITESTTIRGIGSWPSQIRWKPGSTHSHGLIHVADLRPVEVSLEHLFLSHGRGAQGGCVSSRGIPGGPRHVLNINAVRISHCSAESGGGLYLYHTNLNAVLSLININHASANGGGMMLEGMVDVDSLMLDIVGNSAGLSGGGVAMHASIWSGPTTQVTWNDVHGSTIRENSAGQNGGGIAVTGSARLRMFGTDTEFASSWMEIEGNSAQRGGGIDIASAVVSPSEHVNAFGRLRIVGNSAEGGGGLHSALALSVEDSEFSGNLATQGSGGGILLTGNAVEGQGRQLRRLSLHGNQASFGGGAIASTGCSRLDGDDLSIHANIAASQRGQGIEAVQAPMLSNLTVHGNGLSAAEPALRRIQSTQCNSASFGFVNSIVTAPCGVGGASNAQGLGFGVLAGGNAGTCIGMNADKMIGNPATLGLQHQSWQGSMPVLGWEPGVTPRPQQGQADPVTCALRDVRGRARSAGRCDAGAFEGS